ncbi:MAG: GerAB/ArcD/ProY family transporter [Eubacteriales bacterium]
MFNKQYDKFNVRNVCLFLIAFVPVTKIFLLPSIMAQFAFSDMWISALLNVALDTLTLFCALSLWKRYEGRDFYNILADNFGKTAAKIVYALYFLYFILKAYSPVTEQKTYVERTLYESTATVFTFLPFFLVSAYLASKKLFVLGRLADIMFLFTLTGFVLLFALAFANTDFGAVLPIGINGVGKIAKGSFISLNWFGDGVYFFFLMGRVPPEKKAGVRILPTFACAGLLVVLFMVMFYGSFSFIAPRQEFALTEIAKYSVSINNIGRFDYIAVFFLLFTGAVAMALPLYFATECFIKVFNLQAKMWTSIVIHACMFVIIYVIAEYVNTAMRVITFYISWFFIVMAYVVPLLTLFLRRGGRKIAEKNKS